MAFLAHCLHDSLVTLEATSWITDALVNLSKVVSQKETLTKWKQIMIVKIWYIKEISCGTVLNCLTVFLIENVTAWTKDLTTKEISIHISHWQLYFKSTKHRYVKTQRIRVLYVSDTPIRPIRLQYSYRSRVPFSWLKKKEKNGDTRRGRRRYSGDTGRVDSSPRALQTLT